MSTMLERGASDGADVANGPSPTDDESSTPTTTNVSGKGDAALATADKSRQTVGSFIDHKEDPKGVDAMNVDVTESKVLIKTAKAEGGIAPPGPFRDRKTKRLSSSVERVDLEYSLGSLDSPPPSKRQCFSQEPSSAPSSTGSAKKKRISPVPPIKSLAEAMKPKFWQDSASVSENNIASASFDVSEEAGGSSPLSVDHADDGPRVGFKEKRRLSEQEERSIADAEDVMRIAALAAQATPRGPDGPIEKMEGVAEQKPEKEHGTEENLNDFDRQAKGEAQDTANAELNSSISSASSLVESYITEEDYSRPLPPAPPSTPATGKDAFTPLPYQHGVAGGKISYGDGLRRDDLKGRDQAPLDPNTSTSIQDDAILPPPYSLDETKGEKPLMPAETKGSSTRLYQKYHKAVAPTPDISGAVT